MRFRAPMTCSFCSVLLVAVYLAVADVGSLWASSLHGKGVLAESQLLAFADNSGRAPARDYLLSSLQIPFDTRPSDRSQGHSVLPQLGAGYSLLEDLPKGLGAIVFDTAEITDPGVSKDITLEYCTSYEDIAKARQAHATAEYRSLGSNARADVSLLKTTREQSNSRYMRLVVRCQLQTSRASGAHLSSHAAAEFRHNSEQFFAAYGTHFVAGVVRGLELEVLYTLTANSASQFSKLDIGYAGKVMSFSTSGEFQTTFSQLTSNSRVETRFVIRGPDLVTPDLMDPAAILDFANTKVLKSLQEHPESAVPLAVELHPYSVTRSGENVSIPEISRELTRYSRDRTRIAELVAATQLYILEACRTEARLHGYLEDEEDLAPGTSHDNWNEQLELTQLAISQATEWLRKIDFVSARTSRKLKLPALPMTQEVPNLGYVPVDPRDQLRREIVTSVAPIGSCMDDSRYLYASIRIVGSGRNVQWERTQVAPSGVSSDNEVGLPIRASVVCFKDASDPADRAGGQHVGPVSASVYVSQNGNLELKGSDGKNLEFLPVYVEAYRGSAGRANFFGEARIVRTGSGKVLFWVRDLTTN
jgi:hypothetical protein